MGAKGLRLGKLRSSDREPLVREERESAGRGCEEEDMTEYKARKRAIRARMAKTGESYTAARLHVLKTRPEPQPPKSVPPLPGVDLGKSNESILRGSGKSWDEWFAILDAWGATKRAHTEIARHVQEDHGVSGWWAQTVTVGYERGRGMRRMYETTRGFSVGVSKTFPTGVKALFAQFTDASKRNKWIEAGTLRARTSQPGKLARFDFRGESRVHVYFEAKGPAKTTIQVQHEKLSGEAAVAETRAFWKERLAELARRLER
jgi:hypothetical protein